MRRADQRRAAVIALYQHDLTGQPLADALGSNASMLARALADGVAERSGEFDQIIERHSHGWSVSRIHPLERSILRVALLELLHPELVPGERPIPPEGAIEEAVKSAKVFCSSDAPGFINGVLGAVLDEVRDNAPQP
ncbi:MAG TPA: transcription antitermination factor NusB [Solirubrobacteraceae bacterium]